MLLLSTLYVNIIVGPTRLEYSPTGCDYVFFRRVSPLTY